MRSEHLRHSIGRLIIAGFFSLGATVGARAVEVSEQQQQACTPDAFRLCSSEIPDVARITACMEANKARLSAACRAVFDMASLSPPRRPHPTYAHYHKKHALPDDATYPIQ